MLCCVVLCAVLCIVLKDCCVLLCCVMLCCVLCCVVLYAVLCVVLADCCADVIPLHSTTLTLAQTVDRVRVGVDRNGDVNVAHLNLFLCTLHTHFL